MRTDDVTQVLVKTSLRVPNIVECRSCRWEEIDEKNYLLWYLRRLTVVGNMFVSIPLFLVYCIVIIAIVMIAVPLLWTFPRQQQHQQSTQSLLYSLRRSSSSASMIHPALYRLSSTTTSTTFVQRKPILPSLQSTSSVEQSWISPSAVTSQSSHETTTTCSTCRSNHTHIVWYDSTSCDCTWQTIQEAKEDAYRYLRQNIMSFDLPFLSTMGFHDEDNSTDIDGLYDGLIGPVIDLSYQTKIEFLYTDIVPRPIFMEYILNYANVNEGRTNIRTLLWKKLIQPLFLSPLLPDTSVPIVSVMNSVNNHTVADVVRTLNTKMWQILAPSHTDCITFVAGQTPVIFDPMSVLAFGYGSCTGLSIVFAHALRTAGIPARVVGTAAWNQNVEHGNHNWVEIWIPTAAVPTDHTTSKDDRGYLGGSWLFIEASPNQTVVDTIDAWNPCQHWFCTPDRMTNGTQFYAAKLENTTLHFPLAWDAMNTAVPAINRTTYYQTVCSQCRSI